MNDANKETNAAYEEPKKKVYVKLLVFLVLITAIVVVLGESSCRFITKLTALEDTIFIRAVMRRSSTNCQRVSLTRISQMR